MSPEAPEGRAPRSHEVVERPREGLRGEEAGRDMPYAGGEKPSVPVLVCWDLLWYEDAIFRGPLQKFLARDR